MTQPTNFEIVQAELRCAELAAIRAQQELNYAEEMEFKSSKGQALHSKVVAGLQEDVHKANDRVEDLHHQLAKISARSHHNHLVACGLLNISYDDAILQARADSRVFQARN